MAARDLTLTPDSTREAFALDALELHAVREQLARHTSFSLSRELALCLEPCAELEEACRLQAETREALRVPGLRPSLHFGGLHDVRPLAERGRIGASLQSTELLDISAAVRVSRAWRYGLFPLQGELPTLTQVAASYLSDHPGLAEAIQEAIGDDGSVLDSATPALRKIRGELRGAHDRLVGRLREIMASPPYRDVVQDPVVTQRSGRYVIPIRADSRGQAPGIVHDQSASGATLFIEPFAAVDLANRWRTLQVDEEREVERILRVLSQEVGDEAEALTASVEGLAKLDLARARARLAEEHRATEPELVALPQPEGTAVLRLIQARHPLLTGAVVPVTLELGAAFDQLLITGPNTGGKTVALKTAGLLALMAQSGLQIPAQAGSLVAAFQRVQADIGDEQSLQQSLSTFSSHVRRIVRMLEHADGRSLVLLDELGAGTDPQEGAALARAIMGSLQTLNAYVIATTHYPELKAYAHLTPRVENASVEFDVETLSPTYRLLVGTAGGSNALAIAQRLGMPATVLDAARSHLAPRTAEVEAMLGEVVRERAAADDARKRAESEATRAYQEHSRARAEHREAQRLRAKAWEEAREEANASLADIRREALRLRQQLQTRGERGAVQEAVDAVLDLRVPEAPRVSVPDAEPAAKALVRVGYEVFVPQLGRVGRVLSVRDGVAEMEVMGRRVRLPLSLLEGATVPTAEERRAATPAERSVTVVATPRGDVPLSLDLRGLRRDDALEKLDEYLENAALAGLPSARIIHGKGTGAIRLAVREALRENRHVSRFAPEPDAGGGDGATTVWMAV